MVGGNWLSVDQIELKTWIWDGVDWAQVMTPEPEDIGPMAYDPRSKKVVMFEETNKTLTWDGLSWQQLFPIHNPGSHSGGTTMCLDPTSNTILLFGGLTPYSTTRYSAETWSWSGSDWTQLRPETSPPGRAYAAMAPLTSRGQVVLVGGENGAVLGDSWAWNGATWRATPATGLRNRASAVEVGMRVLVFGGGTSPTNDMWWWDGTSWFGP